MSNPEFVKQIESTIDEGVRKEALSNVKLQFKATIFLMHKLCRSCRYKILNRTRQGLKFLPELLCDRCRKIYDKEVTQ